MKKQLFILLACVSLFVVSCKKSNDDSVTTSSNVATENVAKKTGQPFKGSMVYHFTNEYDLPCECGAYNAIGNLYGTGNLTHLGNSTSKIKPCSQPLMYNGTQIGEIIGVECGSFVAANGDELYCYTHPYNLMYTATAAVGNISCDFVGGTGKFKNATGSFTGIITVPYGQGIANFSNIDGLIDY